MAVYTEVDDAGSFFNPKIWTGTGSSLALTGLGFQPDFSWVKQRSGTENHFLQDAVRGSTAVIQSDTTAAEQTASNGMTSFDSDGFTVGTDSGWNGSASTYASWNWKAGTTTGLSGGTITPSSYSYNTTSKLSILKYSGTGSNATIAHMLGVKPTAIIIKRLDTTYAWAVYNKSLTSAVYHLELNNTDAEASAADFWNSTEPTSTVFSIGTGSAVNNSSGTYIAYVFSDVSGYSKMGGYTGNGNADGAMVYTGFRPAYVLVKKTSAVGSWWQFDNKRLGYNPANDRLYANDNAAEATATVIDFVSNGFKFRTTDGDLNGSGVSYIYMAFAEFPIVSSNSKAGTAR